MGKAGWVDTLFQPPTLKYSESSSLNSDAAQLSACSHLSPPSPTFHGTLETDDNSSSDEEFYTPRSSMAFSAVHSASVSSSSSAESDTNSLFSSIQTGSGTAETSLYAYTDKDWLAESKQPYLGRPLSRSAPSSTSSSPTRQNHEQQQLIPPSLVLRQRTPSRSHKKTNPSILMSMTAVLEVDDDAAAAAAGTRDNGKGYVAYTPPPSNVIHVSRKPNHRNSLLDPDSRYPDFSESVSEQSQPHAPLRSSPLREWDPSNRPRTRSLGHALGFSLASSSAEAYIHTDPSHLPSIGTAGYTSLTLPRAPMPSSLSRTPSNKVKAKLTSSGKIDLTTSGVAQTTMSSIEIITGLSSSSSTSKKGRWRIFPNSSSPHSKTSLSRPVTDSSPLAFTAHRPPPSSVSPSQILVQVWAVGVDSTDGRMIGLRLDHSTPDVAVGNQPIPPAVGFIPGRSFVGRILECGFDSSEYEGTQLRKGEWVVGLCDIRKGGSLAEFIILDRHRVLRVPHPLMPSLSGHPSPNSNQQYTLEELALIPLIGVPAYRAVRSLSLAFGTEEGIVTEKNTPPAVPTIPMEHLKSHRLSMKPKPRLPPISIPSKIKHRRALILRGSTPLGLVLIQMLTRRKWECVAHASLPVELKGESEVKKWMNDVEERVRRCGGVEVVFDDGDPEGDEPLLSLSTEDDVMIDEKLHQNATTTTRRNRGETQPILRVIERLKEEGDVFDLVIDTVGGKDIWKASADLLVVPTLPLDLPIHGKSLSDTGPTKDGKESIYSMKTGFLSLGRRSSSTSSSSSSSRSRSSGPLEPKQFLTLVGDYPLRPLSTPKQRFKANLRSIQTHASTVNYVWVSLNQDVDFEGSDVASSLDEFMNYEMCRWGVEKKLWISFDEDREKSGSVVGFEQAPEKVFREDSHVLKDGGVSVIRVVP